MSSGQPVLALAFSGPRAAGGDGMDGIVRAVVTDGAGRRSMWSSKPRGRHARVPASVAAVAGKHAGGFRGRVSSGYLPTHLTRPRDLWLRVDWIVYAVLLSIVFSMTFGFYRIPSASMTPSLEVGDTYVGSKLAVMLGHVHRGDVLVFRDDMGWMDGVSGKLIVKRVIGLPGDEVVINEEGVHVNGKRLHEEYLPDAVDPADPGVFVDVRVPEGRLFMLGDNRGNSADSRFHLDKRDGTIPVSSAVAVLEAQVLPVSGVHRLAVGGQ